MVPYNSATRDCTGIILAALLLMQSCTGNSPYHTGNDHSIDIQTNVIDLKKAAQFDKGHVLVLPYQDFRNHLGYFLKKIDIDTALSGDFNTSYTVFASATGKVEKHLKFPKLKDAKEAFIMWFQPIGFNNDKFFYLYNNDILEFNYSTGIANIFPLGSTLPQKIDFHNILEKDNSVLYYTEFVSRDKRIDTAETIIVDFDFYKYDKENGDKSFLFSSTETVPDSALTPELFEISESPLYDDVDIYHWNWSQLISERKMLVNYAFCGLHQVDIYEKKADWIWSYNASTFRAVSGLGDLEPPYYTHFLNKIESGPHKGRFAYFENGSAGKGGKSFKPARARIFEIDEEKNELSIVWEKVYDVASLALGSAFVMDDYILVNLGLVMPLKQMKEIYLSEGKPVAVDFWNQYRIPLIYLYDHEGNEIANYSYPPGIFSYINWFIEK